MPPNIALVVGDENARSGWTPGRFSVSLTKELAEGLGVGGEKQPVLVASGGFLRLHDVQETRNRDLNALGAEHAPLTPDSVEVEPRYHERQIDIQLVAVRSPYKYSTIDDAARQFFVARRIEWLIADPEREANRLTRLPRMEKVQRILGEKEITIAGDE